MSANKTLRAEEVKRPAFWRSLINCTITQAGTIHSRNTTPKYKPYKISRPALHAGKNPAAEVVQDAPRSQARDLQPGRRPGGGKSPPKIELFGLFPAQFPLEVFGMLPGGISSTRSGGSPNPRATRSVTAEARAARRAASRSRVSATTTSFSVPAASSVKPNATTQPLRTSFGARREFLDFVRIQIAPALDDDVLHRGR